MTTRWYLSRAITGAIYLHVELVEPAPARGYVTFAAPDVAMLRTLRPLVRKMIADLRDLVGAVPARAEHQPVRTFDPVEAT